MDLLVYLITGIYVNLFGFFIIDKIAKYRYKKNYKIKNEFEDVDYRLFFNEERYRLIAYISLIPYSFIPLAIIIYILDLINWIKDNVTLIVKDKLIL